MSAGVLQELDKENVVNSANVPAAVGQTPDRRRNKLSIKSSNSNTSDFKTFQQDGNNAACPSTSKKEKAASHLAVALMQAEAEAARYKEDNQRTRRSLTAREGRIQELKASTISSNARYTALLKSHEEATKELALLRTQLAVDGDGGAFDVERLKATAQSLETSNELLREERGTLETRLAKREGIVSGMKRDLNAAGRREGSLLEEVQRLRTELVEASQDANERAQALEQAASQGGERAQWNLEKAALSTQVSELEAQLAASESRCASVTAERGVLAKESTQRQKEHDSTVAILREEMQSLHRRTSADIRDWQRLYRQALGAKKAVEGQLGRLVGASKSFALVKEKHTLLEASFQEACELLSQVGLVGDAGSSGGDVAVQACDSGPESVERVVEGVMENILGRVFEATRGKRDDMVEGEGEERRREREAEQGLQDEKVATLAELLEKLTAEMVG